MRLIIAVLSGLLLLYPQSLYAKETDHPLDIEINYIKSPSPINNIPPIGLKITPLEDAEILNVRIESSGALSVRSPETRTITQRFAGVFIGRAEIINLPLICLPEGETGKVTITAELRDIKNRLIRQAVKYQINGYMVDGLLYYGEDPLITLMQTHIDDLHRAGRINTEESLRRRQDLTTYRAE